MVLRDWINTRPTVALIYDTQIVKSVLYRKKSYTFQ